MRARNVFAALGLGAFVLVCLSPDVASAQLRRGNPNQGYYPGATGMYSQPYYGQAYYPGMPGMYNQASYPQTAGGYYQPSYGQGYPPMTALSYNPCDTRYPVSSYYGQPAPAVPPSPMPGTSSAYQPGVPMPGPGAAAGGGYGALPAQPGQPGQPTATISVNANDDTFEPKTINIQPGTLVTWTNRGQHPHTVTFPDVNRDSGDLAPGGTFSAVFPYAGTYTYICRHHKGMTGTIVVGQSTIGSGTTSGTPRTSDR